MPLPEVEKTGRTRGLQGDVFPFGVVDGGGGDDAVRIAQADQVKRA